MSADVPPEIQEKLKDALRAGRKDEAERLLREGTGVGPKAAKATIFLLSLAGADRLEAGSEEGKASPEPGRPTAPPPPRTDADRPRSAVRSSSGCGSVVLLGVAMPLLWIALGI